MNTLKLQPHFRLTNLSRPTINLPLLIIPIKPKSQLTHPSSASTTPLRNNGAKPSQIMKPELKSHTRTEEFSSISPSKGQSRIVVLGAVSLGIALFLMGFDDHKALALGPEGPLMEEFWDNMRRYALYALTVSTGALYILLEPIIELLKNPISAVLILAIIGGSIFLVSQVVTAMVGMSDFSYDYNY